MHHKCQEFLAKYMNHLCSCISSATNSHCIKYMSLPASIHKFSRKEVARRWTTFIPNMEHFIFWFPTARAGGGGGGESPLKCFIAIRASYYLWHVSAGTHRSPRKIARRRRRRERARDEKGERKREGIRQGKDADRGGGGEKT